MPRLEDALYDIDFGLRKRGYPAMDKVTLAEVARRLNHPEVLQALEAGQLTTDQIVDEAVIAMRHTGQMNPTNLAPFAEGTQPQLQAGVSGLPPNASRIAGEPPQNFEGFSARNPFGQLRSPTLPFGGMMNLPAVRRFLPRLGQTGSPLQGPI